MLLDRFGSIANAARSIGIPQERLKKAMQRNRFNDDDLSILFPERSSDELNSSFEFVYSRTYTRSAKQRSLGSRLVLRQVGLEDADITLMLENKAIAEYIARIVHGECERFRKILSENLDIGGAT